MKTKKTKGLQKLGGIMAEAVVPNVVIMSDAILEEQTAADKEQRSAQTSNVIAIFRSKSKDNLSDNDINFLFDACFEAYQKTPRTRIFETPGAQSPWNAKP
jgi:hypothetical protein